MNKKYINRKIFFSICIIFILLFNTIGAYALSLNGEKVNIYQEEFVPEIFKKEGKPYGCPTVYGYLNGIKYPAYCVNMERKGVGSVGIFNQEVILDTKLKDTKAFKAVINGFPYKTPEELGVINEAEAYIATKFAVWALQNDLSETYFTSGGSEKGNRVYNAYINIVRNARNDLREPGKPEFGIKEESNWNVIDNKYIEKNYIVNAKRKGKFIVKIENSKDGSILDERNVNRNEYTLGERFKLRFPIKSLNKNDKISLKISANFKTYPVIFAKTQDENLQNYAFSGVTENEYINLERKIELKNTTKIVINKKDEKGMPMGGVEFEVKYTDKKGESTNKKYLTNKDGKIIIENILPGKYIIKELKTKEGYSIYDKDIKFELKFNETKKIDIINNKIEKEIIPSIKNEESFESERIKNKYFKMPKTGY